LDKLTGTVGGPDHASKLVSSKLTHEPTGNWLLWMGQVGPL